MRELLRKIKELTLNTPRKHWLIVFGYHIHKSFWGVLCFFLGLFVLLFFSKVLGIIFMIIGGIITTFSICGHIYTDNKPYFKLWDKHEEEEDEE